MQKEELEPLKDWMKRMQEILNKGKPYTKEERDKMEFNYYESAYWKPGPELLRQFMLKWHPALQHAGPDFAPYIKQLAERTYTALLKRVWENVRYNRQRKSPRDIPNIEFDKLLDLLKQMRIKEPSMVTEQDINDRGFSHLNEKDKKEFMNEINEDKMKSWKWFSGYTREFIGCMQPLFFKMWPELMNMESEWWLLYEYDMLDHSGSLRDQAHTIVNVYEAGFKAKLLEEGPVAISKKLREKVKTV